MNSSLNIIKYRPDIDGLRAIAVSLVVLFHAAPNLVSGGFIGVDVFFVISGYLITSIIYTQLRDESFSLSKFYAKRIVRIFPALILVLVASLILGYFTLLSREYKSLGKHVAAGASYISNFILMKEAGYFDTQAASKPLLHLWSLAIEEQFYLVWPVFLMITMAKKKRPMVVVVLSILISFGLCIGYTKRLPDVVFYVPLTRCWELFIGAGLVFFGSGSWQSKFTWIATKMRSSKIASVANCQLTSTLGFAAICMSSFYFDDKDSFPYWRALLPCIGAALIIASGSNTFVGKILASKPAVWVGLISYPLYLWHWPALFFAKVLTNHRDTNTPVVIAITFSIIAAYITYKLIECRIRSTSAIAKTSVVLFLFLAAVGGLGYKIADQNGLPDRYPDLELQARNIDSYAWNEGGYNNNDACIKLLNNKFTQYCNLMDFNSPVTIALVGDSTANHFYHGLSVELSNSGSADNILQIGKGGCPPLLDVEAIRENGAQNCMQTTRDVLEYLADNKSVRTVILTMTGAAYVNDTLQAVKNGKDYYRLRSVDDFSIDDPSLILENGLRKTLTTLFGMHRKVIMLLSAPILPYNPSECLSVQPNVLMGPRRESCAISQEAIDVANGAYRALILRISHDYPSLEIWDPYEFICHESNCQPIDNGYPIYRDTQHLSIYGSRILGKKLLQKYYLNNLK